MKRYALFTWQDHEAGGGWNDFSSSYDNLDEAIAAGEKYSENDPENWCCWEVIDLTTGQVVSSKE